MCKGTQVCSELGNLPHLWSREAPLPPPPWFKVELEKFTQAILAAAGGDLNRSLDLLRQVRGDDLRRWYLVHGQNTAAFRNRHFRRARVGPKIECRATVSETVKAELFMRDRYRCRYCGLGLVSLHVMKLFSEIVGKSSFSATEKNASHGAALVFRPTPDHVVPLNCGGRNTLDNLVTACYSCNFGKYHYTLEQLGLDDPRKRAVSPGDQWDGLVSLLSKLRTAWAS
jgi:5-methylcytosine-specific restriction endonuclease McrA